MVALAVGWWLGPDTPLLDIRTWRGERDAWTPLLFVLLFGVARVRLLPFLAGTAVGTLPANIAYITAGNSGRR